MDGPVIDLHAHLLVPESAELVDPALIAAEDPFVAYLGASSATYNHQHYGAIVPQLTDVDRRLADMDRMGIDVQVVSIAPGQYYDFTPPELGADIARLQNDRIAATVAQQPDRLVGLGTLPMQDPDAAVAEIERIVTEHRMPGVAINPSAPGRDYDDPAYEPFWAKVVEHELLVVLHPNGIWEGARLATSYLINVVGNPMETTVALSRMIFGGVFERHPGVKVCAVHGGGYLALYPDRMDHAYRVRPDCREHITRPPSAYLRELWFDTVVFGDSLRVLIDRVGAGQVVLGTDYPYDMGDDDPLGRLGALDLAPETAAAIAGGTASRLLGC